MKRVPSLFGSMDRNVAILFSVLVVVMLGYGMILPVLPFYIENLGASGQEMGLLTATGALMQFLFAPMWGSLSDRVGRKPILMVGILGYAVSMVLFGLADRLWMLFAARSLVGILSSAAMPTSMAYISDSTPSEKRADSMGKMGAAVGIGVILGPGISGLLAENHLSLPFFVGAAVAAGAAILVQFRLPESLTLELRQAQPKGPAGNRLQTFREVLAGPLGIPMLLILLAAFGMSNFQGILGLYAVDKYHLGPSQIGSIWAVIGALVIVGQGVLTGIISRRTGEVNTIRISLICTVAGFGIMLLARTYLAVLATTGLFILCISPMGPSLNALISRQTVLKQGITMGVNHACMSLGRVAGPIWAGFLYDINWDYPFMSGGVILLAGFLVSLFLLPRVVAKESENAQAPKQEGAKPAVESTEGN